MHLEIMISELNQAQKGKCCMVSLTWEIQPINNLKNKNKDDTKQSSNLEELQRESEDGEWDERLRRGTESKND